MAELGNTLSRARRARGITLEDAERDTHVSRRYLHALENEDFSTFPAPVYARGFLRTYSRYLGLNPEELIRVFPNHDLTVDITPLPTISRPPAHVVNLNWMIAIFVGLVLLGAFVYLFNTGNDTAGIASRPRVGQTVTTAGAAQQVIQPPVAATSTGGAVQGKSIAPVQPGVVPNFIGADENSALAVLRDNQMTYVAIYVADKSTPKGLISSQTPDPGSKSLADTAITLLVSRGPQ